MRLLTVPPAVHIPVDWTVAAKTGAHLVRPGAVDERGVLAELVENLRTSAHTAVEHVVRVTQMSPADGRDLARTPLSSVHVIDRTRWVQANTEVMATMLSGATAASTPVAPPTHGESHGLTRAMTHSDAISHVVGGAQVGAALALLATKVLGQLDPYASSSPGTGRLLLVAPNILAVERALELDGPDFHLWVCLHEQTHALQFAAAPWLAGHMMDRSRELMADMAASSRALSEGSVADRGKALGSAALNFVRGDVKTPLVDRLLTPTQRVMMADVGAAMALLEGHADVVMDAVGPQVVPSVRAIRTAFDARRKDVRARDFVARKLLGMDAKMAQYRDGAAFVRAVRARGGWDLLNAVWATPAHLPTALEIADPHAWIRRVHG